MDYSSVMDLIDNKDYITAESLLKENITSDAVWHYLYSKVLLSKLWFDAALYHLKTACELSPDNKLYMNDLLMLYHRGRHYGDDYYKGRRHRHHDGCSCCCCDDCCCDTNFSCCDLICLDSCCECMGGDLIDCI